jgi:hypothetical protein
VFSISADSHVTEPGDCYAPRIDPRFRDRAPKAATHDTMSAVMHIDNPKARLAEQDRDGVAAEVVYRT